MIDVGRLQQRIAEEPDARQVLLGELLDLLLVGRHALEPRNRRDHLQQQVQLGVLGHERLDEHRALLRIDARRRSSRRRCRARCRRCRSVDGVVARQRVPVGDEVEAVVLSAAASPSSASAPDQMAEVQLARRPHARDDAFARSHESQLTSSRFTGPMRSQRIPDSIKRVQNQESVGPELRDDARHRRRQHAHQHVAAVERRHGNHVEDARAARSITTPMTRKTVRMSTNSLAVDVVRDRRPSGRSRQPVGQDQVADRPGGRDDREVAPRRAQIAACSPAPASPSRSAAGPRTSRPAETARCRSSRCAPAD